MELGITFSHRHLKYLGLNLDESLNDAMMLGIKWVRLCCYWDEIESKENVFNFDEIKKVVKFFSKNKINIILTVGMKSPRYPEYYFPSWINKKINFSEKKNIGINSEYLLDRTLNFVKKTVNEFAGEPAIKIWQIENEPLDPSGELSLSIDASFLEREVSLIRSLDNSRKVMINLWGNLLGFRNLYPVAIKLADIVGVDLYMRCPISIFNIFHFFRGPFDSKIRMSRISDTIKNAGKELYIAELQAEPWESGEIVTRKDNPGSFLPSHFTKNLDYARKMNPEVVLLWGFEYWLMRKEKGDLRYWNEAKEIFKNYK
ncbi:beta-galactosidase [Candidatus Dojkabacteria bacterium]|nr:beta-galactosidase [Candidatus Dojkabacteria bacterium]